MFQHKMPLILIALMVIIAIINPYLPTEAKQIMYAASLTIKSIIVFLLPVIIFSLLFKASVNLTSQAGRVILLILFAVCCSNFVATFLSHYVGSMVYHLDLSLIQPQEVNSLQPAWRWELPKIISNNIAMLSGISLGMLVTLYNKSHANRISSGLDYITNKLLKLITILIPIFIAGFIVKMHTDGVINLIIKDYSYILIIVALAQYSYIISAYFILSHARITEFITAVKNMLPALISGFATMSSAATMPLTIAGVEKNTRDKNLARSVVPATVNIHLLGDCFAIPIFAYAVMKNFGIDEPGIVTYTIFTLYFVLAKFSVAGVPGGGILVMMPILESYLGFNTNMLSMITALYILFDPVITSANVLGNGAFAKMIDIINSRINKVTPVYADS